MKLLRRMIIILFVVTLLTWLAGILHDKIELQDNIIRLHVLANSDSVQDQANKIQVKNAVVSYLDSQMQSLQSKEEATAYLLSHIDEIEQIANQTLNDLGCCDTAKVSLSRAAFTTRVYDTFSLPAGCYDSLKIQIGQASGQNWWCVVFPALCIPKTTQEVSDVAASSGFDDSLTNTLTEKHGYKIRFFILDWFGQIENLFS